MDRRDRMQPGEYRGGTAFPVFIVLCAMATIIGFLVAGTNLLDASHKPRVFLGQATSTIVINR